MMEELSTFDHCTTLVLIKKIKFDVSLWGWRSYITRDITKVQAFIEQFSKEYNISCMEIVRHINSLWEKFLEEISDIDLLNNESIILSEWMYFKSLDFIIADLTNAMIIRSELVSLLSKYHVLFAPNDSQYVTYLQRSAWSEITTAMHNKVLLTTHKKAFTRRELKALYSNFSYKQIDTPHLLYCNPNFNMKRYPIFLHVPTAGNNSLIPMFEPLLDFYTNDDDIVESQNEIQICNISEVIQNYDFNPVITNIAGSINESIESHIDANVNTEPETISSAELEEDREFVKKNLIYNLQEIDKQNFLQGVTYSLSKQANLITKTDIGYLLLLSLISMPKVMESKGHILTEPDSNYIWETLAKQFNNTGLKITVRQVINTWRRMLNTARAKLVLYREYPDVKENELSDLDLELTYYFNELVNKPLDVNMINLSGHGNDQQQQLSSPEKAGLSRLRSGRESSKEVNYYKTNITRPSRKKNTDLGEKIPSNTNNMNLEYFDTESNNDNYENIHVEDLDSDLIVDDNSNDDTYAKLALEDLTEYSENEDDKPLSAYMLDSEMKKSLDSKMRKNDLRNEMKSFRLKNKYALNKKTANINLPKNHWMNWWKNMHLEDPNIKIVIDDKTRTAKKKQKISDNSDKVDINYESQNNRKKKKPVRLKKNSPKKNLPPPSEEDMAVNNLNSYFRMSGGISP